MRNLTEPALLVFRSELLKEAALMSSIARIAPHIGSGAGVGATLGAMGGAGVGALKSFRDARSQGATGGEAAGSAITGALGGAGKGALLGAGLGAGAGALAKGNVAGLSQWRGPIGAGSRFGQRQAHGLLGHLSPQELEGIRGGAYSARENAANASTAVSKAWQKGGPGALKGPMAKAVSAEKSLKATQGVTGVTDPTMNLTSIPGAIRAARTHGVGKVLGAGLREQVSGASPAMAALTVGAPALATGAALMSKNAPDAQGRGKFERIGGEVGQTVGGVVGGVLPVTGQLVAGGALGTAGRYAGRAVDKLRSKSSPLKAPTSIEPAEGQNTPSERVMSPAAAGQTDIGL